MEQKLRLPLCGGHFLKLDYQYTLKVCGWNLRNFKMQHFQDPLIGDNRIGTCINFSFENFLNIKFFNERCKIIHM